MVRVIDLMLMMMGVKLLVKGRDDSGRRSQEGNYNNGLHVSSRGCYYVLRERSMFDYAFYFKFTLKDNYDLT